MAVNSKFIRVLSSCILLFISHVVFAQNTRLERYLEKGYQFIEGKDSTSSNKRTSFVLPIWGVYPETGWRIGFSWITVFHQANDSFTRPSITRFNVQYTQNYQFSIRPQLEWYSKQNRFFVKSIYTYTYFTENFWGIGAHTASNDKAQYTFELNRLQTKLLYRFHHQVYAGLGCHIEHMGNIQALNDPVSLFKQSIPGTSTYAMLGLGPMLVWDNRDHIYYTRRGHYIEFNSLYFNTQTGSSFTDFTVSLDARKFFKLHTKDVLALQLVGQYNSDLPPFRIAGTLGSDMYMRGYYNGRYRDKQMMAFQAEYRKNVWGPIALTFFAGTGNVGPTISSLFAQLKPNAGIGFRGLLLRKEQMNVRIDYGIGEKGSQGLYFTMGEAF